MSSSINLDLDFQDYTPTSTSSGSSSRKTQQQQQQHESHHVRIPTTQPDSATKTKQQSSRSSSILNILQNIQQTNKGGGGLSDEILQQLIWASNKQKNKQQRASATSSGSWGMGYFSRYFDVTTSDVIQRILWSAVPVRKLGIDLDELSVSELTTPLTGTSGHNINDSNSISIGSASPSTGVEGDNDNDFIRQQLGNKQKAYSYMERFIQSRPDFYGPFWVSATLIFAVAIFSNFVSFMNYRTKLYQTPESNLLLLNSSNTIALDKLGQLEEWHYSMDELNTTASVIIFYVTVIPTLLWFLFWFRGCAKYYTLTETICAYGYSLSIFIPLATLLMIQTLIFRYVVLLMASLLSGFVLMMSFVPVVKSDPNAGSSHMILALVLACQLMLAYVLHRIMLLN